MKCNFRYLDQQNFSEHEEMQYASRLDKYQN